MGMNLFRKDSWKKLITGFGMMKDKSTSQCSVPGFTRMRPQALQALYYGGGVSQTAVDEIAESMVQKGFEVQGDDGSLYSAFENLGYSDIQTGTSQGGPYAIKRALTWTRMLGGAIVIMDVSGAGEWDTPWYPEKGGTIRSLRVYPCTRVMLGMMQQVEDPASPYFEGYERFVIQKISGGTFEVHASRCLLFKSTIEVDPTFPGWLADEKYWGLSEIYRGLDECRNFGLTNQSVAHLMQECSVGKYKLANLEQLVAESDYKSIGNRLEAMDEQKSVINGVFLGEGEDYTRENVSFSGVPEMYDRQMMAVSGAYRIPVTRLFGRSAAGMNATGEGDDDNYSAYIAGLQKYQLLPPLRRLLVCLNYGVKAVKDENGKASSQLVIDFNPLSKKDELKDAQVRATLSQADRNYVESGILDIEEVRKNRFLGGYKIDTSVEDEKAPFTLEE